MKRNKFKGKSGKIYIKNNSSDDDKHYYSVYLNEPLTIQNWIGTTTKNAALSDTDMEPVKTTTEKIKVSTPDGEYLYNVDQFGDTDNMNVTDIILGFQEKYGFDNVKINRNVL